MNVPLTNDIADILGSELANCTTDKGIEISKLSDSKRRELEERGLIPIQKNLSQQIQPMTPELQAALGSALASC